MGSFKNLPARLWVNTCLAQCLNSFLNVNAALVGAFNKLKALVWAISVVVKTSQMVSLQL